jgi:hypothetical protein
MIYGDSSVDEVIRLIIFSGENINQQDYKGDTPLDCAYKLKNLDMALALIAFGADKYAGNWSWLGKDDYTSSKINDANASLLHDLKQSIFDRLMSHLTGPATQKSKSLVKSAHHFCELEVIPDGSSRSRMANCDVCHDNSKLCIYHCSEGCDWDVCRSCFEPGEVDGFRDYYRVVSSHPVAVRRECHFVDNSDNDIVDYKQPGEIVETIRCTSGQYEAMFTNIDHCKVRKTVRVKLANEEGWMSVNDSNGDEVLENVDTRSFAAGESHNLTDELTRKFRLAATLSFGIYDPGFTEYDSPQIGSSLLQDISSPEWQQQGDLSWTEGVQLYDTIDILELKVTVHSSMRNGKAELIFTFRGTTTTSNMVIDGVAALVPPLTIYSESESEGIYVHAGFLAAYTILKIPLFAALIAFASSRGDHNHLNLLSSISSIIVCGHSLGGALATLFAFDLVKDFDGSPGSTPVELITYGCPHVGNTSFARKFEYVISSGYFKPYLFVNKFDPVPVLCHVATLAKQAAKQETDEFVHIVDVLTLDPLLPGYINGSTFSDKTISVLLQCSQHLGAAYINNLETFIESPLIHALSQVAADIFWETIKKRLG